jgi:cysteine desulfurase
MEKEREYYLDYNATTPTDPRVLEEMTGYFNRQFHNPSSFYRKAGEANQAVETARKRMADLVNSDIGNIYFTSGGTESDNLAILGAVRKNGRKGHIITSKIEHPAVFNVCKYLEKNGFEVTYLPVDANGLVAPDDLKKSIKDSTMLVSIMHSNNEIGTIQPLKRLIGIAHERGVLFHSDAVQAVGKVPIDVKDLDIDLMSFSGHKFYGPKGIGGLYKKKDVKLEPLVQGGGHERGLRAGTENVPGIVGLGKAAQLAMEEMSQVERKIRPLRDRLQKKIIERVPEVLVNGDTPERLFNTLNVSIKYIEGEAILGFLDAEGLALSSGSACSSKSLDPSHVLLAIGLKHEDAHGSLRISLGKFNEAEDVDKLIEVLPPVVERLRSMSPFWRK